MYQRTHIKEGMTVRSLDGHKLGKVYAIGDTEFHIEKGLFFPKDYSCRFSEITDIRDGDIILAHGLDSLHRLSMDAPTAFNATGLGAPQYTAPNLGVTGTSPPRTGPTGLGMRADSDLVPSGAWGERAPSTQELKARSEVEEERPIGETHRREEVALRTEGHSEAPRAYTFASDDPLERS